MLQGLRRETMRMRGRGWRDDSVQEFVTDEEDRGLHYVAFLDATGNVVSEYGKAKITPDKKFIADALRHRTTFSNPQAALPEIVIFDEGIVHAVLPAMRRGRQQWGRRRNGEDAGSAVFIEAQSTEGPQMVANALQGLIISLGAAAVLIGAAILFWRQSVKQEMASAEMELERLLMVEELEKDKRLKALGRMSAVLGHQLRNPIASLKGHAQLLAEKVAESHPGRRQTEIILNEALLLEDLTEQILTFARTKALNWTKVYPDDLAHGAVALSGVSDVNIGAEDAHPWQMDRSKMEQVLVNLLINARQASSENAPIDLILSTDTDTLTIEVRDKGEGIGAEDMEKIFEPFYTKKIQGTGIGLALAKQIVESHDGTISARNQEGGGAVFTIRIPKRSGEN